MRVFRFVCLIMGVTLMAGIGWGQAQGQSHHIYVKDKSMETVIFAPEDASVTNPVWRLEAEAVDGWKHVEGTQSPAEGAWHFVYGSVVCTWEWVANTPPEMHVTERFGGELVKDGVSGQGDQAASWSAEGVFYRALVV